MKEIVKKINEAATTVAEATKGTTEQAATKNPEPKQQPKANVAVLINKLPDKVTPKQLCELFNFEDGGKTIRRHLRKNFANKSKHEHQADWVWAKNDPVLTEVVTYFAERYVKEEKKTDKKSGAK